ncbi:hypothetical protein M758_8G032300 [Ceratodon purpureus]|nr:hypothetical protein M758_8G032300 [Ceratodon purpureus]
MGMTIPSPRCFETPNYLQLIHVECCYSLLHYHACDWKQVCENSEMATTTCNKSLIFEYSTHETKWHFSNGQRSPNPLI